MCLDPFTIAAIAGTALSVAGEVSAANAADAAGKANARALRLQGKQELAVGNMNANDIREQSRKHQGEITAQQAQNGVALDSSTAMDVAAADAVGYEQDALRAIYGGQIRQWGANAEASIKQFEGKSAQRAGYIKAAGTLLSSAANAGAFSGPAGTAARASAIAPNSAGSGNFPRFA